MKATRRFVTTYRQVPVSIPSFENVPVEEVRINLELTEDEAQFVSDVMQCVGGDPVDTRRGIADGVYSALQEFAVAQDADYISGHLHINKE